MLTETLLLCEEHAVDSSHQATTLTVQVGVNLLLKGSLIQVSTSNPDAETNCLFLGLSSHILVNGDGGVDTTALTEQGSDSSARSLGGHEDDIDIFGHFDFGQILEDGREAMREVKSL